MARSIFFPDEKGWKRQQRVICEPGMAFGGIMRRLVTADPVGTASHGGSEMSVHRKAAPDGAESALSRLRPPYASVLDLIGQTPVVELTKFDT
ncbi:MAG: hypothetical protein E5X09_06000, partial [Mesorhizobium sp.]